MTWLEKTHLQAFEGICERVQPAGAAGSRDLEQPREVLCAAQASEAAAAQAGDAGCRVSVGRPLETGQDVRHCVRRLAEVLPDEPLEDVTDSICTRI